MKPSGFLWCVPGNSCPDQLTSLRLCICQEGHHDGARWLPCSPGYNCSLCSGSMYIQPLTVALQVEATPALQLDQTQNLRVIPALSFCQNLHPIHQQIIWTLPSKHFQNLSAFPHLPCHHPPSYYCQSLLNSLPGSTQGLFSAATVIH